MRGSRQATSLCALVLVSHTVDFAAQPALDRDHYQQCESVTPSASPQVARSLSDRRLYALNSTYCSARAMLLFIYFNNFKLGGAVLCMAARFPRGKAARISRALTALGQLRK